MNVVTVRLGIEGKGNMPPTESRGKAAVGGLDYVGMVTEMLESGPPR
ncbi:MAG TPA: hypothetical protein VH680_06145 [Gemmatimonadales bacterium]|jgi:hypothetical protein